MFADAAVLPIQTAVAAGDAAIFISPVCEAELARVLGYPLSGRALDAAAQAAALAQCRAIAHMTGHASGAYDLPRCEDPDDQAFLELACDARADVLITKDRDLLALATRKVRPLPFRILTPRDFARDGGIG